MEKSIQNWLDLQLWKLKADKEVKQLMGKMDKTIEEAEKKRKELFNLNKN